MKEETLTIRVTEAERKVLRKAASKNRIETAAAKYIFRRNTRDKATHVVGIIPCSAAKHQQTAQAEFLYESQNFKAQLECAKSNCDEVLILSAKHGLLSLDEWVEPYDVKMGTCSSEEITWQEVAHQVRDRFMVWNEETYSWEMPEGIDFDAWLPKKYHYKLQQAFYIGNLDFHPFNALEDSQGIGEQKAMVKMMTQTPKEGQ